jgi:hypothetical protein
MESAFHFLKYLAFYCFFLLITFIMGEKNKLKQVFTLNKAHDQGLTLHFQIFFALNCQCILKIKIFVGLDTKVLTIPNTQ